MSTKITVDMIACDGHGVCAELLPEHIGLDEWGYPVIRPGPVPDHLRGHARRAVALCPRLAMKLAETRGPT